MATTDSHTADAAARTVQAVLDARPQDDRPAGHILFTVPDPDRTRGRWLHLTEPDLRALLADRARMAAELEQARGERTDVEAWLGGRIEALRKVLRSERDANRAALVEAESLRRELDEASRIVLEIGNALDSSEMYGAIGDLAQLFASRTSAMAKRMEAADLAIVQRTTACVWVWEYAAHVGNAICDVATASDLGELKKQIAESFPDHTWEEVERRGIRGTSILVGYGNGRYADTGHWVYRRPAIDPSAPPLGFCTSCGKRVHVADNGGATPHVSATGWCTGENSLATTKQTVMHDCDNCDGIAPESCPFNPDREA